jgi:hypothetical protein
MTDSPAFLPLVLMSIAAPLGAIDVLYFHMWKFRLYARAESRAETVTHIVRQLLVAGVVLMVARYEPRGTWFWVIMVGMGLDVVNNIIDVTLEPASRRGIGGLPRLEYVIHIVGATASGAFAAAYTALALAHGFADAPTSLDRAQGLPSWIVWNASAVSAGGVALAVLETVLLVRALPRRSANAAGAIS